MTKNSLLVNGQAVEPGSLMYFSGAPYGQLRAVFLAIGGTVVWQGAEGQAVVTWRNNLLVVPSVGQNVTLNGQQRTFAEAHRTVEGRLWVSLGDLARVFFGKLRVDGDVLHLFLPTGLVSGLTLTGESLVLHWSGQVRVAPPGESKGMLSLAGSSWAMPLRRVIIEQTPDGHLALKLEPDGRELDFTQSEQGLRVSWPGPLQRLSGCVIALDAGHGGQQPGAVGTSGVLEKDLARQVVDLLLPQLKAFGATVVDIRPGDEQVSLAERVRRSLANEADLFISVHYNAHERNTANGTETFHAVGNVEAARLAGLVQEELIGSLRLRDRGVRQAAFHVLRGQMNVPAILVEVGFLTNPEEEAFLKKTSTMQKTAEALHRAILRYFS